MYVCEQPTSIVILSCTGCLSVFIHTVEFGIWPMRKKNDYITTRIILFSHWSSRNSNIVSKNVQIAVVFMCPDGIGNTSNRSCMYTRYADLIHTSWKSPPGVVPLNTTCEYASPSLPQSMNISLSVCCPCSNKHICAYQFLFVVGTCRSTMRCYPWLDDCSKRG